MTQTDAPASRTVRFRVSRFKQGDPAPHFDEFDVPVGGRTTILDAMVAIRNRMDSTLTLRHSCFHASCGTCGMRVNDREALACVTNVDELGGDVVKVEPLANQELVSDLVTDMVDFYDRLDAVDRALVRHSEAVPGNIPPEGIDAYTRYEDCIECGLCVSACPVVAADPRYIGPAALAAAWRVQEEPRGADRDGVLGLVDDPQGMWRCHTAWECSDACPSGVYPAESIMRLRRRVIGQRLGEAFGRGRTK